MHSLLLRRQESQLWCSSMNFWGKAISFRNLTPYIPPCLSFQMEGVGGGDCRLSRMIAPKEYWGIPGNVWLMVFSFSWSFFLVHLHRGFPQNSFLTFTVNFNVRVLYWVPIITEHLYHRIQEVQMKCAMSFERPETHTCTQKNNAHQKKYGL